MDYFMCKVIEGGYFALFQLEVVNKMSIAAFSFHQIIVSACLLYLPIIQQQHLITKLQILQRQHQLRWTHKKLRITGEKLWF